MSKKEIGRLEGWRLREIGGLGEQLTVGESGEWHSDKAGTTVDVHADGVFGARRVRVTHRAAEGIVSTLVVIEPADTEYGVPAIRATHFDGENGTQYDSTQRNKNDYMLGYPVGIGDALRALRTAVRTQHEEAMVAETVQAQ